jgi:hypothetical protein
MVEASSLSAMVSKLDALNADGDDFVGPQSLGKAALESIPESDKKQLSFDQSDLTVELTVILRVAEDKKQECERKQWAFYTNKLGRQVMVRDTLNKVCEWIERFKSAADSVVQIASIHAAIPWLRIRILLQVTLSDCQIFGAMAENVETISGIIV